MAGEYFGLLRSERPDPKDLDNLKVGDIIKEENLGDLSIVGIDENSSKGVDENIQLDSHLKLPKHSDSCYQVSDSSQISLPITIKGNSVPNANQIRFVSNEMVNIGEGGGGKSLENGSVSIGSNGGVKGLGSMSIKCSQDIKDVDDLEGRLLELEVVDSVLVSTIQTTAALEQRRKRENKNSYISAPAGSFLMSSFYGSNGNQSDSTNEDDTSSSGGGNNHGLLDNNRSGGGDGGHLINANIEEIEEYKYLVLRFMHQQNGDDDFRNIFENFNPGNGAKSDETVAVTATNGGGGSGGNSSNCTESQVMDSKDSLVSDLHNSGGNRVGRFSSRGLKRRGSLRNQGGGGGSSDLGTTNTNICSLVSSSSFSDQASISVSGNRVSNNLAHISSPGSCSSSSLGNNASQSSIIQGNGEDACTSGGAIAASAVLEGLITSVRGSSGERYRQQMMQAYPQNRFVAKKKCKETNEILAKYVSDLANEYCHRNFGSSNLADGYINAFNSHVLRNSTK